MGEFKVIVKPHPLKSELVCSEFKAGKSIAEVVGPEADDALNVSIEGEYIPREMWERIRPKTGTEIQITRYPRSDSAKKIIGVILLIVIAIFAPYLAGWLVPYFGAYAGIVAVGITMLATMAAYALIPPPEMPKLPSGAGAEFNRLNSITGTSNQVAMYGTIPMVIGECRYYPTFAANPYTEISGDQQYLRMLLDLGYGDLVISDIRIGETLIDDFDDVQYEIEETPELFSDDIFELSLADGFDPGAVVNKTSQSNSDELSIDIIFPQGLFAANKTGKSVRATTSFHLEYKPIGSATWSNVASIPYGDRTISNYSCYVSGGNFVIGSTARKLLRVGIRWKLPARGQYDIRVTRFSTAYGAGAEETAKFDKAQLTVFRSIKHTLPSSTGTLKLALRIKATDQLNGVINQLSVLGQQKIPVWDGVSWSAPQVNFNPAWVYCWLLMSCPGVAVHVLEERIDLDAMLDWANDCTAKGFTCKGMLDSAISSGELYKMVLSAGRASFAMRDGKYSVLYDRDGLLPVQHFTPVNSKGFSGSRRFVEPPHALRVKFQNPALNWQEDEIIVLDDNHSWNGEDARGVTSALPPATIFETLTLPYVTEPIAAWQLARYHFAQGIFRQNAYSWTADIENLVCTRGDLVYRVDDVTRWGSGYGFISDVVRDGSNRVIQIIFAEPLEVEVGETYTIRIRTMEGESIVANLADMMAGPQTVVTPVAPLSAWVDTGNLYMIGTTTQQIKQLLITRIEPGRDLSATIEAVEYNPAVQTFDDNPPTEFISAISGTNILEPPPPPTLYAIFSSESADPKDDGGSSNPGINIGIDPGSSHYITPGGKWVNPRIFTRER